MPNWCENATTIEFGSKEEYDRFTEIMDGDVTTECFFERFYPCPEVDDMKIYNWKFANWGTKWDVRMDSIQRTDYPLEFKTEMYYWTAWSPPVDFWVEFSTNFPTATITNAYVEEGVNFIGKVEISAGDILDETHYGDISREMYLAAGAVLGEDGDFDWDISDYDLMPIAQKLEEWVD